LPAKLSIDKDFGAFTSSVKQEGNSIKVVQRLLIKKGTYPASKDADCKEFITTVNNACKAQIVLKTL